MQANGCCFCCQLLFLGLVQYVKLISAEEDQTTTQASSTGVVDSSDPPFSPSTTIDGNKHLDLGESDPTEIPPSDITTILMCAAPALILVLLIPLTIFMIRRKGRKKHIEVSDGPTNEDTKGPIFEEDTPSVMEIEMEDLDKWMSNMKTNSLRLSTLEEEKKQCISLDS